MRVFTPQAKLSLERYVIQKDENYFVGIDRDDAEWLQWEYKYFGRFKWIWKFVKAMRGYKEE